MVIAEALLAQPKHTLRSLDVYENSGGGEAIATLCAAVARSGVTHLNIGQVSPSHLKASLPCSVPCVSLL